MLLLRSIARVLLIGLLLVSAIYSIYWSSKLILNTLAKGSELPNYGSHLAGAGLAFAGACMFLHGLVRWTRVSLRSYNARKTGQP